VQVQSGIAQCVSYLFRICLSLVCVAPIELLPFGLARRSVVVWFSTLLTLPTRPGVSAVLPETCAISSVMHVNRLPHYSPSRGVSPATTSAYVMKCFISLDPSPLVISSYRVKAVPKWSLTIPSPASLDSAPCFFNDPLSIPICLLVIGSFCV
jgi:hypothetical protein